MIMMTKNKPHGHYESDGLEFESGEVPECSYCGAKADETTLFETNISGGLCCGKDSCKLELAQENMESELEFISEEDKNGE
jgi:hypothetical protein